MAITRTFIGGSPVFGNKRASIIKVVDTEYATGGISMTAALCGFDTIEMLIPIPAGAVPTWSCVWDYTNNMILVYTTADGAEVVALTDLTTGPIYALVIGV